MCQITDPYDETRSHERRLIINWAGVVLALLVVTAREIAPPVTETITAFCLERQRVQRNVYPPAPGDHGLSESEAKAKAPRAAPQREAVAEKPLPDDGTRHLRGSETSSLERDALKASRVRHANPMEADKYYTAEARSALWSATEGVPETGKLHLEELGQLRREIYLFTRAVTACRRALQNGAPSWVPGEPSSPKGDAPPREAPAVSLLLQVGLNHNQLGDSQNTLAAEAYRPPQEAALVHRAEVDLELLAPAGFSLRRIHGGPWSPALAFHLRRATFYGGFRDTGSCKIWVDEASRQVFWMRK